MKFLLNSRLYQFTFILALVLTISYQEEVSIIQVQRSGSISTVSDTLPEFSNGLQANYFNYTDPQSPLVDRIDEQINFDWGEAAPDEQLQADEFGVKWTGYIAPLHPGKHRIILKGNGGLRFWFDGEWIYEEWPSWNVKEYPFIFEAEPGIKYPISIEYQNDGGPASIQMLWESDSLAQQLVPSNRLFHAVGPEENTPVIPRSTDVSPLFLEGTSPKGNEVIAYTKEEAIPIHQLDSKHYYLNVPLSPDDLTELTVMDKGSETILQLGQVQWTPTLITFRLGAKPKTIREGDQLLLLSRGSNQFRILGADTIQVVPVENNKPIPFAFEKAGSYTITAVAPSGLITGSLQVLVVGTKHTHRMVAQVNATFLPQIAVQPENTNVYLTGNEYLTVGRSTFAEGLLSAQTAVIRRGSPQLIARLQGPKGPIIKHWEIEEFSLDIPALRSAPVDAQLHQGQAVVRIRPYIPDLLFSFRTVDTEGIFRDESRAFQIGTSAATSSLGEAPFQQLSDLKNREIFGEFHFEYYVPPEESTFCWELELYDQSIGFQEDEFLEIPLCLPPWIPENVCRVIKYRSLIFSKADDEQEDEQLPDFRFFEDAIIKCKWQSLPPSDNLERWQSRQWHLVSSESSDGSTGNPPPYRLQVSEPERDSIRLDNPIPALFGKVLKTSACKVCDQQCEEVHRKMDSGTIPGLYTTKVIACEATGPASNGSSEDFDGDDPQRGGAFLVSKVDAHGTQEGTTDKFPDYAEVLPKRGGYVNSPVIQIDWGGEQSVFGCSLYGNVCTPLNDSLAASNEWQFTAVAKDHTTEENIPPGYTIEWSGIPSNYQVIDSKNGQDLTIRVKFPPGRHFPTLKVFGPVPITSEGNELVGKAEIHSIVVEERPTCDVGGKNPDVDPAIRKGTAFHTTNQIGKLAAVPIDARIGIQGSNHPHPNFNIRGRVALDGYPQNEYWVTAQDLGDLPQVVTIPPSLPVTYYLQGYGLASLNKDDLRLKVEGQAQLEVCASKWFFRACPPCDSPPPPRFPVHVQWQETDTEAFNTAYPIVFNPDEPDLKYVEEDPAVWEVAADFVADDYQGNGNDQGYYIEKGLKGRVNALAGIDWSVLEIDTNYLNNLPDSQALKIDWYFAPLTNKRAGPNYNNVPTLRDLEQAVMNPDSSGKITVLLKGLDSRVQLDFTKLRDSQRLAKARDCFCLLPLSPFSHPDLGQAFWPDQEVEVRAGDVNFHITIPNKQTPAQAAAVAKFNPWDLFDMKETDRIRRFESWQHHRPFNSGEESDWIGFLFDEYFNPTPYRDIMYTIDGGTLAGNIDPSSQAAPQENHPGELFTQSNHNGRVELKLRRLPFPNCPWQYNDRNDESVVNISYDGRAVNALYTNVTRTEPLPSELPPLYLELHHTSTGKADPNNSIMDLLDIAKGDQALITAVLTRGGKPLEGVDISFTSVNGKLQGGNNGVVSTNAKGEAKITLTAADAKLDHDGWGQILVMAQVAGLDRSIGTFPQGQSGGGTVVRRSLLKWIDSSLPTLSILNDVLCPDANGDSFVDVEDINGNVRAPITDWTKVVVKGQPNHQMRLQIAQINGPIIPIGGGGGIPGVKAEYPFELIAQGITPDAHGSYDATVSSGVNLTTEHREGFAAASLTGNDLIVLPNSPAVEATSGLQVTFWIRPNGLHRSTLIDRQGQYRLDLLANGKLELATYNGNLMTAKIISDVSVAINNWSYVEAHISETLLKIGIGPDPNHLNAVYAQQLPGAFVQSNAQVQVGQAFSGLLDDLTFLKGGFNPPQVEVGAVAVGSASGSGFGPNGTFTTDANGRFEFTVKIQQAVIDDYRPVTYILKVFGSDEATAKIRTVPKKVYGGLYSVAKAFLTGEEGLSGNATDEEKIAAMTSNWLPLISDLRTLSFEIYKAATGCDEVSWLNVTFAVVGLVADIFTFGTASTLVRGTKGLLKQVFQKALKAAVLNGAMDITFRGAMEGFIRLATIEITEAEGGGRKPAPWVEALQSYLTTLQHVINGPFSKIVNDTYRSADDFFVGLKFYHHYGIDVFREFFHEANSLIDDLPLASAPTRGPPLLNNGLLLGNHLLHPSDLHTFVSPPRLPLKTMRGTSQKLKQTMAIMAEGIDGIQPNNREAIRGLQKLTHMVVKGARNYETNRRLALRIRRGLKEIQPGSRKKFLEDFNTLYILAKQQGGDDMLRQVQDMARDFAARGRLRKYRKGRTKGAAYAIQEAKKGLVNGRLRGADALEPKSPLVADNRLFRDLFENYPGGRRRYVELKAYRDINAFNSPKKVAAQIAKHFKRLPQTPLIRMNPVVIRYTGIKMTLNTKNKIIGGAIRGLISKHGFSKKAAKKWAFENITFERVPLDYAMRP